VGKPIHKKNIASPRYCPKGFVMVPCDIPVSDGTLAFDQLYAPFHL